MLYIETESLSRHILANKLCHTAAENIILSCRTIPKILQSTIVSKIRNPMHWNKFLMRSIFGERFYVAFPHLFKSIFVAHDNSSSFVILIQKNMIENIMCGS